MSSPIIAPEVSASLGLGRKLLIVMGSGMSAGVGAPTMTAIHRYLRARLPSTNTQIIVDLLDVLDAERESPRSVQVRLYHLLQTSSDPDIRAAWAAFGIDLMMGLVANNTDPAAPAAPLWALPISAAHNWAARLGILGRAILISLNFDGLTKKAVEFHAPKLMDHPPKGRKTARVLSTPQQIRGFFTGVESATGPRQETTVPLPWRPVPVIKFRGDVFHAVCKNGRCPEFSRPAALYDLFDSSETTDEPGTAEQKLGCKSCGLKRELEISFPGVHGKEREIEEALGAFHEVFGCGFGAVCFMGFSGTWDESLVDYLVSRSKVLSAPIISISRTRTPAIEQRCKEAGVAYRYIEFASSSNLEDPMLEAIISSTTSGLPNFDPCAVSSSPVVFPDEGLNHVGADTNTFEMILPAFGAVPERKLSVVGNSGTDSFTEVGSAALRTDVLLRLERCSQLGLKGEFVHEKDAVHHSRFHHSAGAALIGMLWYEALLPQASTTPSWAWGKEARIATELAVLFHDARHLPFSHMMEEVFHELNWGQTASLTWPDIPRYVEEARPTSQDFKGILLHRLQAIGSSCPDIEEWWNTVTALQNGTSGIPWLDGIIDSPLDADKIEYIFHDTRLTGQNVRLTEWTIWFEAFISGQSITPEGLIRLENQSCVAALQLLQERAHLYRQLYLAPELRVLECLARYIVVTWLEWKVPEKLSLVHDSYSLDRSLRGAKSEAAGKLLWEKFTGSKRELDVLGEMVIELQAGDAIDPAALAWIQEIWKKLLPFKIRNGNQRPTLHDARTAYAAMNPVGPIFLHQDHEETIRMIVRRWRVHYPMVAMIDVARFPRFLATPKNRTWTFGRARAPVAEHFLVPSPRPSEWHRKARATTPLHHCDFSGLEFPVIQLVVFDPWGESNGGAAFLFQMLLRELQSKNIPHWESPEQVVR